MAKRNMPKMAKPENLQTKVEEEVLTVEEPVEVEEVEEENKDDVEKVEEKKTRFVTVVSDKQLRLRVASSTSADVLALLNPGTQCEVIDEKPEWLKVNVAGKVGYVMSKFVK